MTTWIAMSTMGQAIKYARKGSTIVLVAVFAGMAEVDLAVANDHELDIKSTIVLPFLAYLIACPIVILFPAQS